MMRIYRSPGNESQGGANIGGTTAKPSDTTPTRPVVPPERVDTLHRPATYSSGGDLASFAPLGISTQGLASTEMARDQLEASFLCRLNTLTQDEINGLQDQNLRTRIEALLPFVKQSFDTEMFSPQLIYYAAMDAGINEMGLNRDEEKIYKTILNRLSESLSIEGIAIDEFTINLRRILRARIKKTEGDEKAMVLLKARNGETILSEKRRNRVQTLGIGSTLALAVLGGVVGLFSLLNGTAKEPTPTSNTFIRDHKIFIPPLSTTAKNLESHRKELKEKGLDEKSINTFLSVIRIVLESKEPVYIEENPSKLRASISNIEHPILITGNPKLGYLICIDSDFFPTLQASKDAQSLKVLVNKSIKQK